MKKYDVFRDVRIVAMGKYEYINGLRGDDADWLRK